MVAMGVETCTLWRPTLTVTLKEPVSQLGDLRWTCSVQHALCKGRLCTMHGVQIIGLKILPASFKPVTAIPLAR